MLQRFNEDSYAHFVTTNTFKNKLIFANEKCCLSLIKDLDYYRKTLDFKLLGYVIMPDHLHMIIMVGRGEVSVNEYFENTS
ncbi:MAG: hypothetical protein V1838_03360 [Patescibacteria group bacterium]